MKPGYKGIDDKFQFPIRGSKLLIQLYQLCDLVCFSFPLGVVRLKSSTRSLENFVFQFPIRGSKT